MLIYISERGFLMEECIDEFALCLSFCRQCVSTLSHKVNRACEAAADSNVRNYLC